MMCKKIGIENPIEEDKLLVKKLLSLMELYKADYTNTFAALTLHKNPKNSLFISNDFQDWKKEWYKRINNEKNSNVLMQNNNPIYIPRNHLVELALKNAINRDKKEFDKLLNLMSQTYNYSLEHDKLQTVPEGFDESYKTFCGT